ncbi:hypothetical protein [Spirosoma flavum]|uniref:Uncharacterized protein n=1 Tax=Spirosoma flavum TaxID=2048557 RepID=A0ABW6ALP3_9BACT
MKQYEHSGWKVVETDDSRQIIVNNKTGAQYERLFESVPRAISVGGWISLIKQANQLLERPKQAYMRRAVRVLAMLAELHKAGFQRLRFHTQDRGIGLRLYITTVDKMQRDHGAIMTSNEGSVLYVSGMKDQYFDWTDAATDNARQLASKFMIRFPELVEQGRGLDFPYAGWFQYMLGLAERGYFPIVYSEYTLTGGPYIDLTDAPDEVKLLKPPGGEGNR